MHAIGILHRKWLGNRKRPGKVRYAMEEARKNQICHGSGWETDSVVVQSEK